MRAPEQSRPDTPCFDDPQHHGHARPLRSGCGHCPAVDDPDPAISPASVKRFAGKALPALALAIFAGLPASAVAENVDWNGSVSDDWFAADNWTPAKVPAAGDNVTIDTDTVNATVVDGAATADLNLLGIGTTGTGTGQLSIINGGSVTTTGAGDVLAEDLGSSATLEITGSGSNWTTAAPLSAGSRGTATMTLADGGRLAIGGSPATLTLAGDNDGTATLAIGAGGAPGILDADAVSGGSGSAAIQFNHTGSDYHFTDDGTAGGAAVAIDGSAAMSHLGTGTTTLTGTHGYTGGTTIRAGTLTLDAATVNHPGADLIAGEQSGDDGTLVVAAGTSLGSRDGLLGHLGSSAGAATVTGTGSVWTIDALLNVGDAGSGALTVANGARVDVTSDAVVGVQAGSDGAATVTGAELMVGNGLGVGVGGPGTLTIDSAGTVTSGLATVGTQSGITGEVTLRDGGTSWTNSGSLVLGIDGTGVLTVDSGATLSSNDGLLGQNAGGSGTASLTGTGSAWTMTGGLTVGGAGTGDLNVAGGAAVSNGAGVVGNGTDASGSVTVSGTDSSWSNNGDLTVGSAGTGTLDIDNSASVESIYGFIGRATGSNGTVNVSGAGSSWTSAQDLIVGRQGTGTLVIDNGATVSNDDSEIGKFSGASGDVTVRGTGSTWNHSGKITLAPTGSGTLTVADGGTVVAPDQITSASNSGVTATVNIGTGTGPGILDTPSVNVGAGSLQLHFNHDQPGYHFTRDGSVSGTPIPISGNTTIHHDGPGSTLLAADNTYTGNTHINAGTLAVQGTDPLGDPGSTVFMNGGVLGAAGDASLGNPIQLDSDGTIDVAAGATLTLNGAVDGPGSLTKTGDGTLSLDGAVTHNPKGTTIHDGKVVVNSDDYAHPNFNLTIGNQAGDDGILEIRPGGVLENVETTIGAGTGAKGTLILDGGGGPGESNTEGAGWGTTGSMYIGRDGGEGTLILRHLVNHDGMDSDPLNTEYHIGYRGGNGNVILDNYGTLYLNGPLRLGAEGGTGTLELDNSTLFLADISFDDTGIQIWTEVNEGSSIILENQSALGGIGNIGLLIRGGTVDVRSGSVISPSNNDGGISVRGVGAGTTGRLTVDGAGSDVRAGGHLLAVGDFDTVGSGSTGTGVLEVRNGAILRTGRSHIGLDNDSSVGDGVATVDGADTLWRADRLFVAGGPAMTLPTGTLTVSNGARVAVDRGGAPLRLGRGHATLNIGDGAGPGVINATMVEGISNNKTATLNFNHDAIYHFTAGGDEFGGTPDGTPIPIAGNVKVDHIGPGTTVLLDDHTYTGDTSVDAGTLVVEGTLGDTATTVADGATLAGGGSIAGAVTTSGGTLAPGTSAGTLSTGTLTLDAGATLEFELDAPGTTGGGVNDLIAVSGDLVLDGTLEVTNLGGLANGTYTLITYTGALTDNGINVVLPEPFAGTIDTSTAGEVRLDIGGGPELTLQPELLDFGDWPSGTVSEALSATITNTGDSDLVLEMLTLGGEHPADFMFVADGCSGMAIPAGQACSVQIDFSPGAPGIRRASATIPSNAPTSPDELELLGTNDVVFFDGFEPVP